MQESNSKSGFLALSSFRLRSGMKTCRPSANNVQSRTLSHGFCAARSRVNPTIATSSKINRTCPDLIPTNYKPRTALSRSTRAIRHADVEVEEEEPPARLVNTTCVIGTSSMCSYFHSLVITTGLLSYGYLKVHASSPTDTLFQRNTFSSK
jgi:hypothetical protein